MSNSLRATERPHLRHDMAANACRCRGDQLTLATMVATGEPSASQAKAHKLGHWCRKYLQYALSLHQNLQQHDYRR